MKRKLFTILFVMLSLFTLTSCVTTVEAQDGVYTTTVIDADDIEMAIMYGIPYIVDDVVQYYLYNNLYYYPFYTRGHYYYHVYSRPLIRYPRYWHPVPRNHWFRDGKYHNPHGFVRHHKPVRRPDVAPNRTRPDRSSMNRPSSTRQSIPNRTIGGTNRVPQVSPNRTFGNGRPSRGVSTPSRNTGGGHFGGKR